MRGWSWVLAAGLTAVLSCAPRVPEEDLAAARGLVEDASAPPIERARAHQKLGIHRGREGFPRDALAHFEAAVELFDEPSTEQADTLNYLSNVLFQLGDYERLEEVLWRALEVAGTVGDRANAAVSWNNLGVSFAARGRPSAALAAYQQCLELRRGLDDPVGTAATRHNIGVQQLLLGRVREGVDELRGAVAERRELGHPGAVGKTLASLAWGLTLAGRVDEALATYAEAVELMREAGVIHDLAVALEQRSQLLRSLGRFDEARIDLDASFGLLEGSGGVPDVLGAYLHLGLGAIESELARGPEIGDAVARLRQAVVTFDAAEAQEGRVLARLELARALRRVDGGHQEAVRELEDALEIVETARSDLRLPSFRATFLGGWQAVYQELVDVLASAAVDAGSAEAARPLSERALAVVERGRARALLDRMASEELPVDPGEVATWRDLRGQVEALEARALSSPSADDMSTRTRRSGAPDEAARAALGRARFAYEQARETARRDAPSPDARPASFDEVRRHLDGGTVMLIYALSPRRSWLWRLDAASVELLPLPPGAEIDAAARHLHKLLPLHDHLGYGKAAREALERLARQVLGPVAGRLGTGRLVVVPDGPLHLVPFGALPAGEGPLAASHEVVHLPSASTLVELRGRASRPPAPRLLAVVADPVFEASDPRLTTAGEVTESPAVARTRGALGGRLGRLPATAAEGLRIAAVARDASGVAPPVHLGFDARRELVMGGELGDVRILHLATHGVVDAEDPALAGLVLSLYDPGGRPQDGLLRARDLHDLRLDADLVVLSACRTALGQEVRGEGIVGLAGGFFAAGARHLVVSLWDVDDRATAELMGRFYRHLLVEGRSPGEALRRAQQELREQTEWRSPSHWAAFVAMGDPEVLGSIEGGVVE